METGSQNSFGRSGISGFFWLPPRKKSLAIEVRNPKELRSVKALVRQVDVVVENYKPWRSWRNTVSTMNRLSKSIRNSSLCSVSGYGQDGPYAHHTSFDIIAQAQSGVMSMTRTRWPPEYVGNYLAIDPVFTAR